MVRLLRYLLPLFLIFEYNNVFGRSPPWNRKFSRSCECRIVGGDPIRIEEVPYQVHLRVYRRSLIYYCGGSIINARTVVTAGHCLEGSELVQVRTSTSDLDEGGLTYNSSNLHVHPKYENLDYDVGVIKLEKEMNLDGVKAKPVKLTNSGTETDAGTIVTVSGWGRIKEGGITSKKLLAVNVPVISEKDCKEAYGDELTPRMLCASDTGKDACQGDSGGPAVSQVTGELVGIVSWGTGCAKPDYPGVYAKVADPEIYDFIKQNTVV